MSNRWYRAPRAIFSAALFALAIAHAQTTRAASGKCRSVFDSTSWTFPKTLELRAEDISQVLLRHADSRHLLRGTVVMPHELPVALIDNGYSVSEVDEFSALLTKLREHAAPATSLLRAVMDFSWIQRREDLRLHFVVLPRDDAEFSIDGLHLSVLRMFARGSKAPQQLTRFDFPTLSTEADLIVLPAGTPRAAPIWISVLTQQMRHAYDERVWRDWVQVNQTLQRRGLRVDALFSRYVLNQNVDDVVAFQFLRTQLLAYETQREALKVLGWPDVGDEHWFKAATEGQFPEEESMRKLIGDLGIDQRNAWELARGWSLGMDHTVAYGRALGFLTPVSTRP